jgi:hypothetical protein
MPEERDGEKMTGKAKSIIIYIKLSCQLIAHYQPHNLVGSAVLMQDPTNPNCVQKRASFT